ncbi:MAG: PEP-CTERM system TPR-repeat protein PrsT [Rubrivivax sp.]|nr:PEP-CTERM system TPR-repeat protein PrsT [Rubrivivax sp.]
MTTPTRARWCRLLVATVLSASVSLAWGADPRASQFYEDALQRFEKKDHKGAIIQLKNAIKLDRNMLSVHVLLGRALLANGELNAAEAAFDEALKLGVNPVEVVLPLAEAMIAQGKPDQLLSQARFAHAALPPESRARLLLMKASAASDVGSTRDALKLLEEARALNANNAESWAAEVPIRVRARQLPEARAAADKAVALDPKSPVASYQQATVAHVTGDLKTAVAMYTRTLSLKPDHVDALVARAGLYIDLKQTAEATADVAAARKADAQDPRSAYLSALLAEQAGRAAESRQALVQVTHLLDPYPLEYIRFRPQVLMLGGMSHFALNQYEKAKPYLEMVVRQDASSPVSKLLARIYLRENRVALAVESLEAYLRAHPGDQQATLLLASSQMALGRHARATHLMQEALKKGDDPAARALLGMSLAGSGKFAPAAAELEATLKKDPTQIQAGVSLVGLYIASGQGTKAAQVAERLVRQRPDNPGLSNLLGSALAAKGDGAAARVAFEQSLKLDPAFGEPQLNLARLDIDQRDFDAAQARLNVLLKKDEKNVDALMETARLFGFRGQPEEALRWLQRADDNSGQRLQPGLQLVDFQLSRGRPDLAREAVRRLQNKAPEALAVLLAHARVLLALGEASEARSTLTRAATLVAFDPAALSQIAELQVSAGNLPGAAHALDKALTAKPDHLRARGQRSSVYLLQGDAAKAEQLARSVLASDPKIGLGHGLMGDVARSRNQLPAAIESYKRAHELDRNSNSLLKLFTLMQTTQRPAAVALAEQWLRSHPRDVGVWRALGDAQARAGNWAGARSAYESLVKLTAQDADALNNLAAVLVNLRDPGAFKVAEQALALKPQTPYIIGTAGWAAFHAGQHDRALQLLRDARLRDPNNAGTRYFLGAVLAQQGRKAEARQELQAALSGGLDAAYAKEAEALLRTLN